jgi:uncharacterized protein (TIGR04255 family)
MAVQRHLARAPITEALFDFRATLPKQFDPEKLKAATGRLADRFPNAEEQRVLARGVDGARQSPASETSPNLQGYFFKAADGLTITQFRVDGFTLNRLSPYTGWNELLPHALDLWGLYLEITKPESVPRIGVRYLNRLTLPTDASRLSEYISDVPRIPLGAPETMRRFVIQTESRDAKASLSAIVTQALDQPLRTDVVNVFLDIDVYCEGEYVGWDVEQMSKAFFSLRRVKNDIFFGRITEATARLYE